MNQKIFDELINRSFIFQINFFKIGLDEEIYKDLSATYWGLGGYNVIFHTVSALFILFSDLLSGQNGREISLKVIPLEISFNFNSVDTSSFFWVFFEALVFNVFFSAV
jgi:hypothetical protein